MELTKRFVNSYRGGLIISGTTIGAGMLGIPMVTAACGMFVASFVTILVWAFMLVTGLLLLEVALTMKDHSSFMSISKKYLGTPGSLITGGLFVFLYIFLLVAYFAAGAPLVQFFTKGILNIWISETTALLVFAFVFGAIVAKGPKMIDNANLVMTIILAFLLVLLISVGLSEVSLSRLGTVSWSSALMATPILFSAFGYHNLIPSLVTYMNRDKTALKDAIIIGTTIPLVVYLMWQFLLIGALPSSLLQDAAARGVTATTLFAKYSDKPWITIIGQFFSFFAITTSVIGVSFSLVDFLGDALKIKPVGNKRAGLTFLAFFVPLSLAMIDRAIFIRALSIAGGIGEALLNGVIPVALVYSMRYIKQVQSPIYISGNKALLAFLVAISALVFGVEVWHLIG